MRQVKERKKVEGRKTILKKVHNFYKKKFETKTFNR